MRPRIRAAGRETVEAESRQSRDPVHSGATRGAKERRGTFGVGLERTAIEFRVLGPLEASRGGRPLSINGKPASLLALLLVHRNEVVSTERLIDGLWGEAPPKSAAKLVQGYVSQLRRSLAAKHGDDDSAGGAVLTRPSGYVLRLDAGQLDADRFRAMLDEGRTALGQGDADAASEILRDALALWRGPPLADFAYERFAQEEIARLDELRLIGIEERVEADLALGRQAEVVGELEALIAQHPLRERLRAQLMLALYRCDRQSEALQAYQEARRLLVEELGLEPSRRLRDLEQAILRQDPTLDLRPTTSCRTGAGRGWPTGFRAASRRCLRWARTRD